MVELIYLILSAGLFIFFVLELFVMITVLKTRKKFQWMITNEDEDPVFPPEGYKKFMEHGFDHDLGWVRKPNTSKNENGTTYRINEKGARTNPKHEKLPSKISTYGDSFTFCRQNNDDTTWQYYLSEATKTNVLNFGVGNYGFDQALLRLKREYPQNPTKTVIIGVVPSTIVRIMCVWKHWNEYGNIFGFKPRFKLNGGQLEYIPLGFDREYLKKYDYFYKKKFRKEMIRLPFLFHFLKNARRNIKIVRLVKKGKLEEAMMVIQEINLKLRKELFLEIEPRATLRLLVKEFIRYSEEKKFKPVLLIIPQKDDVTTNHFYKSFLDSLKNRIAIIDMRDYLKKESLDELYSDDNKYGGHPNPEGNKLIAKILYSFLREE